MSNAVNWLNDNTGAVQALAIGVLVIVTAVYAGFTWSMARSSKGLAESSRAELAELVRHRNLLERQMHADAIASVRAVCDLLFTRTAPESVVTPTAFLLDELERWVAGAEERLFSLPPDVIEAFRPAYDLANEIQTLDESGQLGLSAAHLRLVVRSLAFEGRRTLDNYLSRPGQRIPRQGLPASVDKTEEWVRAGGASFLPGP
jgi:hypothetical protein